MRFPRCRWGAQLYGAGHWDWNSWREKGFVINGVFTLISILPVTTWGHLFAISPAPATTVVCSYFDNLERFFYFIDLTLKVIQVKTQFISQNWQMAKILLAPDCTDGPFSRHSWLPWGCWADIRDTENHAIMGLLMGERNHVGPLDVPYLCTIPSSFFFLRHVPISLYRHTGHRCSPRQHSKLLSNFLS